MAVRKPRKRRPTPTAAPDAPPDAEAAPQEPAPERLQKVLAAAGLGSRRQCEEIIQAGRVEIDGQPVTELGTKVDPARQNVVVDGVPLKRARPAYYAVYKPEGVVSTNFDPDGRPRVIDLLPEHTERVFSVGRLDRASEGLMLLTNDGALAQALTHPKYGVAKTYEVIIAGRLEPEVIDRLLRGVHLAEGFARVANIRVISRRPQSTLVRMVLREGRNREIRRVLARVGHKALKIKRIGIAGLRIGSLKPGQFRRLTHDEIRALQQAATRARQPAGERAERPAGPPKTRGGKKKKPAAVAAVEKTRAGQRPGLGTIIGGESPSRPFKKKKKHARR